MTTSGQVWLDRDMTLNYPVRTRAKGFKSGDVLSPDAVVEGVIALVRGGVRVALVDPDGTNRRETTINGRYVFTIERPIR